MDNLFNGLLYPYSGSPLTSLFGLWAHHQVHSLHGAASEHSISVKGSQVMGGTKENKLSVFQLLMQDQRLEQVWSRTLPKENPVLNFHCEHQDYPTHPFNTLTVLQCFIEGHGIVNLWISSRRALLSPLKTNEWAIWGN